MSADNGVYILKTKGPEFRVAHLQGIDAIYKEWSDEGHWLPDSDVIRDFFGPATVFTNLEEAHDIAEQVSNDIGYSEYGTNLLTDFENMTFEEIINEPSIS